MLQRWVNEAIIMMRTNTFELVSNREQKKLLMEMMTLSSCVWNMANFNFRQSIFKKKKTSSFFKQQQTLQNTKDYQRLGRSYALPMLQKHSYVVSGYFGLIKSKTQKKAGLPKYFKNRKTNTTLPSFLRIDSLQYRFKDGKIILPLSRQMRKETGLKGIALEYMNKPRWKGKNCSAEIHYNRNNKKFYLYQAVEILEPEKRNGGKSLAIDIGIKRGITCFDGSNAEIYSNPIVKEWKKLTSKINRLQKIAKTRNNKYSSKQIQRLYEKRTRMMDNYYKNIVSWTIKSNNPSRIVVGDVSHILDKPSESRAMNQTTHNLWSFALLYKRLQNKCEELGIEFIRVPEPFTTKTCPSCGSTNKPFDRNYKCSHCGYEQDRDINGAINIFRQNISRDVCLHPMVKSDHLFIGGNHD